MQHTLNACIFGACATGYTPQNIVFHFLKVNYLKKDATKSIKMHSETKKKAINSYEHLFTATDACRSKYQTIRKDIE